MKRFSFRKIFVLSLAFLVVICPLNASALTDKDFQIFSQNNIMFYDPDPDICVDPLSSSTGNSDGSDVYIIGDSMTISSQNEIKKALPNATINAHSEAYFSQESNESGPSGVSRVSEMGNQSILVFALGTNGGVNDSDISALFEASSGKNTKIILMTIYYADNFNNDLMNSTNEVIKKAAETSNVSLMDWAKAAGADPEKYILNDHINPTNEGKKLFAETIKKAVDELSTVESDSSTGNGNFDAIYSAKNADKYVFNVGDYTEWSAKWGDGDVESMAKLLKNYGDLAYQLGKAVGAPYIAVLVQMRYEDPNSVCGANNFWGNGCDSSHAYLGGATIKSVNLGEGFYAYAKTLTNGLHDQALGIEDPKEYLEKIGPTWVQGSIDGPGYALIEYMKNSVDSLTAFIESPEGQEIVKQFGNYTGTFSGKPVCLSDGSNYSRNGVTTTTYKGTTIAFPIAYATKSNLSGGRGAYTFLSNIPCNNSFGCHYGEGVPSGVEAAAFDVCFDQSKDPNKKCAGATVVSMTSGTITMKITTQRNGVDCNHVRVLSDHDNKTIAYMHLEYDGELANELQAGTHIDAGTIIGHVGGNSACHDYSTPHVHIDMSSIEGDINGASYYERDPEIVSLMNTAYEALPENDEELAAREAAGMGGASDKPIEPVHSDSTSIDCDPRTSDIGTYTGYYQGNQYPVRLCALDKVGYEISGGDAESYGQYGISYSGGHAIVSSRVSGAFAALAHKYYEDYGRAITATSSFRTNSHQAELYYSLPYGQAASPGWSNHQGGLAVDFATGCGFRVSPCSCQTDMSMWLMRNVKSFGLARSVGSESWHVDTDPSEAPCDT